MLGNSSELKVYKPILHKKFGTEFGEIFKGSKEFDPSSSNKFKINFMDYDTEEIVDHREFRVSWQDKGKRFRIIPKKKLTGKKITEAKVQWPSLYLGLSRLLPIGETRDEDMKSLNLRLNNEEQEWFIKQYKEILSLQTESFESISQINISNTVKRGIGITTSTYDHLTNSSGQDNIGQILCALLSFKRLKDNPKYKYKGGLLLIDEIDATLHPFAQKSLIQVLIKQAKKLKIQIVCTTHSISLLESICDKTEHNQKYKINNIELIYLTNENYKLEIMKNPKFKYIENELLITSIVKNNKKINIYVEDNEAKWFLNKLIEPWTYRVNIISSKIGDESLMRLNRLDQEYFSNVIIVLDGDTPEEEISKSTPIRKNILQLPGSERPESVFYNFILSLNSEHEFLTKGRDYNFSLQYFSIQGPNSHCYKGSEREKYKEWFKEHIHYFDLLNLYAHWENDNIMTSALFIDNFRNIFNEISRTLHLPLLK